MVKALKSKKALSYILLLTLIIGVLSFTGCTDKKAANDSEIVAKVGDVNITKEELYDLMVQQNGQQILDALIVEKIVELEVKSKNIEISEEEVEEEFNKMKEELGGEIQFNQALQQSGLTTDVLKDNITMNFKINKLIEPYISISDEEMQDYFEENKSVLAQKEEVKASHILVDTKEEADEVKEKLDSGEDFGELAKEHSKDGSSEAGGDLGFFGKGKMVPEFEEVAFKLGIDEISEPVKSEFGYHIIKVHEKIEGKNPSFEDMKDDIKDIISNEKSQEAYGEWYEDIREEYEITNYLIEG
ncbi:MAG TPA: peptidylprolyl isomerase [Tissierellaceae bacterium]|nr:peptidylprolyl isomerase [Tissierellaceae bacterium]